MAFGRRPVAIPVALGGGTGCDHPCAGVHTVGIAGVFVAKEGGVFVAAVFPKKGGVAQRKRGFAKTCRRTRRSYSSHDNSGILCCPAA